MSIYNLLENFSKGNQTIENYNIYIYERNKRKSILSEEEIKILTQTDLGEYAYKIFCDLEKSKQNKSKEDDAENEKIRQEKLSRI